jgi:hypothetical protein
MKIGILGSGDGRSAAGGFGASLMFALDAHAREAAD